MVQERVRVGGSYQEDPVQAAWPPRLRQRRGLPQRRAHHPLCRVRQADLPRGVRNINIRCIIKLLVCPLSSVVDPNLFGSRIRI